MPRVSCPRFSPGIRSLARIGFLAGRPNSLAIAGLVVVEPLRHCPIFLFLRTSRTLADIVVASTPEAVDPFTSLIKLFLASIFAIFLPRVPKMLVADLFS